MHAGMLYAHSFEAEELLGPGVAVHKHDAVITK